MKFRIRYFVPFIHERYSIKIDNQKFVSLIMEVYSLKPGFQINPSTISKWDYCFCFEQASYLNPPIKIFGAVSQQNSKTIVELKMWPKWTFSTYILFCIFGSAFLGYLIQSARLFIVLGGFFYFFAYIFHFKFLTGPYFEKFENVFAKYIERE